MNDSTQTDNALVRNEGQPPATAAAAGIAKKKRKKSRRSFSMPMLATVSNSRPRGHGKV
jgi:hypothetical protein